MPGPPMLDNVTAVYMCPHGGKATVSGGTGNAVEGGKDIISTVMTPSIAGCPGVPPAGIPACTLPKFLVATGTSKQIGAKPTVLAMDIQMSVSNGFPLIPASIATKVVFS